MTEQEIAVVRSVAKKLLKEHKKLSKEQKKDDKLVGSMIDKYWSVVLFKSIKRSLFVHYIAVEGKQIEDRSAE